MTDVTMAAQDGYRGNSESRPAHDSSPNGMAYLAGMQHRTNGGRFPTKARMGRGAIVHINSQSYNTNTDCQEARWTIVASRRAEVESAAYRQSAECRAMFAKAGLNA